jgi:hypothetical protein
MEIGVQVTQTPIAIEGPDEVEILREDPVGQQMRG